MANAIKHNNVLHCGRHISCAGFEADAATVVARHGFMPAMEPGSQWLPSIKGRTSDRHISSLLQGYKCEVTFIRYRSRCVPLPHSSQALSQCRNISLMLLRQPPHVPLLHFPILAAHPEYGYVTSSRLSVISTRLPGLSYLPCL